MHAVLSTRRVSLEVRASSSSSSSPFPVPKAPTTSRRSALASSVLLLGAGASSAALLFPPAASAASKVGGVGRAIDQAKARDARKAAMKARSEAIREKKAPGFSQTGGKESPALKEKE